MENNNIYYNYVYMDPRKPGDYNYGEYHFDYEPFYVGKGCKERYRKKHNKDCEKLQEDIRFDGLEVIYYFLYENLSENTALGNESKLIKIIGRKDKGSGPLLNKKDCDYGNSGQIVSDETRRKISEANKGRKHTEETKQKMSEIKKGKKPYNITDEIRKNMSEAHKGEKQTEETKQKHRETMIERYKDPNERRKTGEATKLALSDPKIRQKISEKTKIGIQKMSKAQKRRKGENHPMYGKHHTEETRRKISVSLKKRGTERKECNEAT